MDTSALPQLARRMLASGHADDVVRLLREGALRLTGARRAEAFVWDARGSAFRGATPDCDESLLPPREVTEAAFTEAQPVTVPHARGGVIMVVPLRVGLQRVAALVLDVSEAPEIGAERLASCIVLGEHAATALNNMRVLADTQGQFALLSNVLESITNGIITTDRGRGITHMNRNAMAMLGVGPLAPGAPMDDVLPEGVVEAVDSLLADLEQQGFCLERQVKLRHSGGPELPLAVSVSPLREESGSSTGFIVVLRDMTASQELERLRHLDQLKSQFVANVSHELKTPLTSIRAYGEALMDLVENEQGKEFLRVIDEESDRLLYLINDLLNISRIQSGKMKLNFEMTDPASLVPEALRIARIRSERHHLVVDVEPGLPPMLLDRDKIREVLINLISNAVKYSPNGGRVGVRMRRAEGNVRIEVQDEGIGISREHQEKLFQMFYRVDSSLTYEVSGTGLGLAIVKAIAEHHGGRVWVESEPGRGSTFFVLLPIRAQPAPAPGVRSP